MSFLSSSFEGSGRDYESNTHIATEQNLILLKLFQREKYQELYDNIDPLMEF
jgi:hypothetical protein